MKIGDIVLIVNSESIPKVFLGQYGVITEDYDYKVSVKIKGSVGNVGSLSHTAYRSDLKKVGELTAE